MTTCFKTISVKTLTALALTGAALSASAQTAPPAAAPAASAPSQGDQVKRGASSKGQKTVVVPFEAEAPVMKRAFTEAQRTLNQFLMATSGDNPNLDNVGVRARFTSGPHTEYLWVMPVGTADGKSFKGQINDMPKQIRTLTLAQEVQFKREDIVDWMYQDTKTKVMHGHYTTCALMKDAPKTELAEMKQRYGLDCAARLKRLR